MRSFVPVARADRACCLNVHISIPFAYFGHGPYRSLPLLCFNGSPRPEKVNANNSIFGVYDLYKCRCDTLSAALLWWGGGASMHITYMWNVSSTQFVYTVLYRIPEESESFFFSRIYINTIEGYEHIHATYFCVQQHHFCTNGKSLAGEYD